MHTEEAKGVHELEVFDTFIERSGIPVIKDSIEKRPAGEPDILCNCTGLGAVAFELARICDPDLAALLDQREPQNAKFIWTSDPSLEILKKKRSRSYKTDHPIELLLYTDGRVVTPDDDIVPTIKPYLECNSGPYRRVWFMGETTVECVYEAS